MLLWALYAGEHLIRQPVCELVATFPMRGRAPAGAGESFKILRQGDVEAAVERLGLPILKNPCPANHNTKREYAKNLIKQLGNEVPNAKQSILGAIYHPERMNLWQPKNHEES